MLARLLKIRVSLAWWGLILALTFVIHSVHNLNSDEGVVLAVAWDIFGGKKLYNDVFQFVAPGSFYLIFWIWKIFGVHYFAAKFVAILAIFFTAIGIFKTARIYTESRFAYIIPIFFVFSTAYWPIISYHTFILLFTVWAVYFFAFYLSKPSLSPMLWCGVSAGLAIIFLQNSGFILEAGLALWILFLVIIKKEIFHYKALGAYLLYSAAIPAGLLLFWPASILFDNLVRFPFFNYSTAVRVPGYLIYFFGLIMLYSIWILRRDLQISVIFLIYIQSILLLSSVQLADHFHVVKILFPLYILFMVAMDRVEKTSLPMTASILFPFVCASLLIMMPSIIEVSQRWRPRSENIAQISSRINCLCSDSEFVYAGPFIPNFYFELRKKNPSPHAWMITNHHSLEHFQETAQALKAHRPQCALLNYKMVEKYHYDLNNPVDQYIAQNYHKVEDFRDIALLIRNQ